MHRLSVVLMLLTFVAISGLEGQDSTSTLHPEDAGFAMLRRPVASGAEFARCLRENDIRCLQATPEELLKSYQRLPGLGGLLNVEDLANRAEKWSVEPCPRVYLNLARLLLPSRVVDFLFARWLRVGEMCFFDNNLGQYVGSAGCGNAFAVGVGRDEQPAPSREVSLSSDPEIKDSFFVPVPTGTRISHSNGEHMNVFKDTVLTIPRASVWRFGVYGAINTYGRPAPTASTDTVFRVRVDTVYKVSVDTTKGSGPWPWIIGVVVGSGIGWFANVLLVDHKCKCSHADDESGGPLDPPNRLARDGIVPSMSIAGGGLSGLPTPLGLNFSPRMGAGFKAGWRIEVPVFSIKFRLP